MVLIWWTSSKSSQKLRKHSNWNNILRISAKRLPTPHLKVIISQEKSTDSFWKDRLSRKQSNKAGCKASRQRGVQLRTFMNQTCMIQSKEIRRRQPLKISTAFLKQVILIRFSVPLKRMNRIWKELLKEEGSIGMITNANSQEGMECMI